MPVSPACEKRRVTIREVVPADNPDTVSPFICRGHVFLAHGPAEPRSASRRHILIEAEEVRRIVLRLQIDETQVIASERRVNVIRIVLAEKIQQTAA
jgi:hypothetical protein